MAITHNKDTRKPSGGLRRLARKKKKFEMGRPFVLPVVGKETRKTVIVRGGKIQSRLLKGEFVNISDGKKVFRATILKVVEHPSNPFFIRRNVLTKGAIIETNKGYARVTSRPGQQGDVSAILLKNFEPAKKKKKSVQKNK